MFDSTRYCNTLVLISYTCMSLFTMVYSYLSIAKSDGDINIVMLFSVWGMTCCLLSAYYYNLLNTYLNILDKTRGGYLNNNFIDYVYRSIGLLYLNAISGGVLTILDMIYYYYTYSPNITLSLLSCFKYIWHIMSIISTLLLIYNIKDEIKPIPITTNLY